MKPILPVLSAVALMVLASAAFARSGLQWVHRDGDESVVLAYEVPDTSDQLLYLGCDKEKRTIDLSAQFNVKGLAPGKPVTVTFSRGGSSVSIQAKTETDELFPFAYPAAKAIEAGPLLALLAGSGEVIVKAHKGSVKLSDAGRAKAVEAFRAKCPAR